MEVYFYSRISTVGQNSARQLEEFKKIPGFHPDKLYADKIQGNIPFLERPEAAAMFDKITSEGKNVTVVVDSIDRLGRDLINILQTIQMFSKNGINLKSLKEGFETLINGQENPIAKIVVSVMGSISEMERQRIKERTKEGIQIAKAHGKYKGRKVGAVQSEDKLLSRHPIVVSKLKRGLTYRDIREITGKSTATIAKVKKAMEKRGLVSDLKEA